MVPLFPYHGVKQKGKRGKFQHIESVSSYLTAERRGKYNI